jgi:hypothetical protein
MEKKPASSILIAVRFYTYFFSFSMAVCLFLPVTTPRPRFMDSELIDILARCILWLWLVFAYWCLSTALTSQIRGAGRYFLGVERNTSSLVLLVANALGLGVGIWLLTQWAFHIFVPGFIEVIVSLIAILNGLLYAMF